MPSALSNYDPGLCPLVEEFSADWSVLHRRWKLTYSPVYADRKERLITDWQSRLSQLPFNRLSHAGKVDFSLLRNHLGSLSSELAKERAEAKRLENKLPFARTICELDRDRTNFEPLDAQSAAKKLDDLAAQIAGAPEQEEDALALQWANQLRQAMKEWAVFYQGYDPEIDWWVREPLARVLSGLDSFCAKLEEAEKLSGQIPSRPVGREGLINDLKFDMVPYTPERLIEIGEREYAWCMDEMLQASAELGFGDDWKAAQEHVKQTCLPPGQQPQMVVGLAREAEDYVAELVTVPKYAKEVWRMEMMAAERQKVSPFFLGGEAIIVSYPTDTMTYEEKAMSMRGNNPNFSRATVQHELIPGHHLQFYMLQRHRPYRKLFSTPFWIEGWTIYWEFLLWQMGFPRTPEERIGMLFWRIHRCARVVFSLKCHMGLMTTQECVDMLVDRVGHERLNAEGEVRRSFNGTYPPLYQAAYLLGGIQFRAISEELQAKGWSLKQIHDAMLRQNQMPPAMMRLALLDEDPPERENPEFLFDG